MGRERGVEEEHSLYNSILIVYYVYMCTCRACTLMCVDVRTAIEASGVTRLPLVKAQMG